MLTCNTSCTGIEVTNDGAAAGTIAFSNATKTLNTGAATAVNLDNNDGQTISFTGGGLDIDTTSGGGFDATNGGTVTVTGTNNTILSTTGIALNVVSTDIGLSGLNFVSIAANGGTNGIILNGTGTTAGTHGGLTVAGSGSACTSVASCTGGAIQNTTSDGIRLITTRVPSLTRMAVVDSADSGITMDAVTDFTIDNSFIFSNGAQSEGGAIQDSNVHLEDLVGTS